MIAIVQIHSHLAHHELVSRNENDSASNNRQTYRQLAQCISNKASKSKYSSVSLGKYSHHYSHGYKHENISQALKEYADSSCHRDCRSFLGVAVVYQGAAVLLNPAQSGFNPAPPLPPNYDDPFVRLTNPLRGIRIGSEVRRTPSYW